MHHVYETEAYVLRVAPSGEADMLVTLMTERFGVVRASAQGIRYEKSKLRFAVQPYARVTASLVRGKGMWRLTNAQVGTHYAALMLPEALVVLANVCRLLERLLPGEEADPALFEVLDEGVAHLALHGVGQAARDIEAVLVLRLLHQLGYVGADTALAPYITIGTPVETLVARARSERDVVVAAINRGLRESQL
ncbi:MAG: hypothetical protein RL150_91 [Candidatus Parcubacteria bacterium]|jgi:DNA repair protein RecO (recombination protein O)